MSIEYFGLLLIHMLAVWLIEGWVFFIHPFLWECISYVAFVSSTKSLKIARSSWICISVFLLCRPIVAVCGWYISAMPFHLSRGSENANRFSVANVRISTVSSTTKSVNSSETRKIRPIFIKNACVLLTDRW